ncbi:MAG: helix-turn-helix domain-containing protein [Pseudonocardiaceae bacterium]
MEDAAPEGSVGRQLALQRKLAGLTQQQLAARIHFSASLISQVERGVVPASPALTSATARALGTDVEALTGQPYGARISDPRADHAGVPGLRAALDCVDDPGLSGPPMTAAELRTRLDECKRDQRRSRYSQITAKLPELLQHTYVVASEARPASEAAEAAWALLDDAYQLAGAVSYSFGYFDLEALTSDRRRDAALRSGDPLRAAMATGFGATRLRLCRGDYGRVLRVVERAQSDIADERSSAADAVRAQLHLRQGITHARAGAADRADEHITAAHELVELGIPAHPYYEVIATPGNVGCYWVAAPVELTDGTTAVDRAGRVLLPDDEQPSRLGHHWVDVARAWTLHGDREKALDALNRARRIAPQLTRYHPTVHETVRILAETERRATDSLAGFARWIGVQL